MCSRAVVFAAVLITAPLGAQAADLLVWWAKGQYANEDAAVREIIAAFEQKSGNRVQLVLGPPEELVADVAARSAPDGASTISSLRRWIRKPTSNGPTRVGSQTSRPPWAAFPTCSIPMRSSAPPLLDGKTGQRNLPAAYHPCDVSPPDSAS
jgi:hypothetical protein